jgi:hypothetical protein
LQILPKTVKVQRNKMLGMEAAHKNLSQRFVTQNLIHHTQIQNLRSQIGRFHQTQRIKQVAKKEFL